MTGVEVVVEQCVGCGRCVSACPFGQIALADGVAAIAEGCTLCGSCATACDVGAIRVRRGEASPPKPADHSGIWVFAAQSGGQPHSVAYELLGEARRLTADRKTPVTAVLIGSGLEQAGRQLIQQGADRVLVADHPRLAQYNDELYADIFARLIARHRPAIVLIGATAYGRSLAPRVASRLDTGLTADCTELAIDQESGLLLQTRPAFGGNLMATIICPHHRPQMATVRPRVMRALPPDPDRKGTVLPVPVDLPGEQKTKVLAVARTNAGSVNLADAEIVVAVGQGIGSRANLAVIDELAAALGAVVGVTRPLVDAGWIDYSRQIGQTGKTVAPKLYIACGISGAVQHLAGMSAAETVVAINRDPDAPIFSVADYCLVGDVLEIVPALLEELRVQRVGTSVGKGPSLQ